MIKTCHALERFFSNITISPWIYMSHSSPNRPSCDPHHSLFFSHIICCKPFHENTIDEVFDFLKNFLGSISSKITQKRKMFLLDVVDLYKIWTVNSMWQKKFWTIGESGRGFGLEIMRKLLKKIQKISTISNLWYEGFRSYDFKKKFHMKTP